MSLHFTKMHGLGNDFMVIDGVNHPVKLTREDIQALSQRHTGVGFDQCLIVEPSSSPDIDFFYRIYNANGESVGQCGNGARCIARFIQYYKLSNKQQLKVATTSTQLTLKLNTDETVTVNMGKPIFEPEGIPFDANHLAETYEIKALGQSISIHALSVGNPHAILLTDHLEKAPVNELGKAICEHPLFPQQVNVSFLKIITPGHIALRVFERGCGETQACGSAAVAAAVAGQCFHQLQSTVQVDLPGGTLIVERPEPTGPVFLTGPATFSYEGIVFDTMGAISNDDVATSIARDALK